MTSKDEKIQQMYDEIKIAQNMLLKEEEAKKNIFQINNNINDASNNNLSIILYYIKRRLSINDIYMTRSLHYKDPFKKLLPRDYSNYSWGGHGTLYSIAFIECNIIINMSVDMIKKIPILNTILLENKGLDNPMTIKFKDYKLDMILDGPILYITTLPLGSLLFKIPPTEWVTENHMSNISSHFETYFKYNNVEEAIMNRCYFD